MLHVSLMLMYRIGVIRSRASFGTELLYSGTYSGHFVANMHNLLASLLGKHVILYILLFKILALFPLGFMYSETVSCTISNYQHSVHHYSRELALIALQ